MEETAIAANLVKAFVRVIISLEPDYRVFWSITTNKVWKAGFRLIVSPFELYAAIVSNLIIAWRLVNFVFNHLGSLSNSV